MARFGRAFPIPRRRTRALTAGTVQTQSLSGTVTTAGALVRSTSHLLAGTLTTAGELLKRTARALTGTLTTAGVLVAIKTALKSLAGTLTTAGALSKQTQKAVSGTLTTSGSVLKRIAKLLAGTLSFGGTLSKSGGTPVGAAAVYDVGPLDVTTAHEVTVTVGQLVTFTLPIGGHD